MALVADIQKTSSDRGRQVTTAYASISSLAGPTRSYMKPLQDESKKADEQSLRYLPFWKAVDHVLYLVKQVGEEGADWDDAEGATVSTSAIRDARAFVTNIARRTGASKKTWASPAVSATPEGGIHLSWHVSKNRVTLTFRASSSEIVCVSKFQGGPAQRELLPASEAVARVLNAFETASPAAVGTGHTLG